MGCHEKEAAAGSEGENGGRERGHEAGRREGRGGTGEGGSRQRLWSSWPRPTCHCSLWTEQPPPLTSLPFPCRRWRCGRRERAPTARQAILLVLLVVDDVVVDDVVVDDVVVDVAVAVADAGCWMPLSSSCERRKWKTNEEVCRINLVQIFYFLFYDFNLTII